MHRLDLRGHWEGPVPHHFPRQQPCVRWSPALYVKTISKGPYSGDSSTALTVPTGRNKDYLNLATAFSRTVEKAMFTMAVVPTFLRP